MISEAQAIAELMEDFLMGESDTWDALDRLDELTGRGLSTAEAIYLLAQYRKAANEN